MKEIIKDIKSCKVNNFMDFSVLIFLAGICLNNGYLFVVSSVLLLLHNIKLYITSIKENIVFFVFNFTVTFFLLNRFILVTFFNVDFEYLGIFDLSFSKNIEINIIKYIYLSLLFVNLAYHYFMRNKSYIKQGIVQENINNFVSKLSNFLKNRINKISIFIKFSNLIRKIISFISNKVDINKKSNEKTVKIFRNTVLILFFITAIVKLYYIYLMIKLVRSADYGALYLGGLKFSSILSMLIQFNTPLFLIYLATSPKGKKKIIPMLLFVIIGGLEVLAGVRKEIALNITILVIYFVLNMRKNKISIKLLIIGLVLSLVMFTIFIFGAKGRGTWVEGKQNKIVRLLYNQGVSARVIGIVEKYRDSFPDGKIYSLGLIIDNIKSIENSITGVKTEPIKKATRESALDKNVMGFIVSYIQYPYEYLNTGYGLGSSYVAELLKDFYEYGIILGSIFYGWLIYLYNKYYLRESIILKILILISLIKFVYSPRESFGIFLYTKAELFIICMMLLLMWVLNKYMNIKGKSYE